ncbi:MAG: hypothetical protein LC660_08115 [Desulfobacteraceae bacterium]|nr:hypothetical protein [Desulfobacteraceae bacterium]
MTQITAITKQSHADKFWTRYSSYSFASKSSIANLVGAEIAKAVTAGLPMAFVKDRNHFLMTRGSFPNRYRIF